MAHMIERNKAKTSATRHFFATLALVLGGLCAAANSQAGSFILAGETFGHDVVTHPTGYSGAGGAIVVNLCIQGNVNAAAMEQSVKNVIAVYNRLQPTTGNLQNGKTPFFEFDFESVLLHEVGHCLGLGHVNLASESGLAGADRNYTKTTDGPNNMFNINAGADAVRGSSDDARDDDVNLHWFRDDNNNPFTIATTVDSATYSRDTADLPAGHAFAANADRTVGSDVLNTPGSEAAMQQGTSNNEIQRTLVPDDVATLRYAMSGFDEQEGTADDYTFSLNLDTTNTDCDINIQFNNAQTGFASCGVGASTTGNDHWEITSANVYFNDGTDMGNTFDWHFNTAAPCNVNLLLTQSQWKMISLPCDVGTSTVADVFGDDLGGVYDTDWVVFERDAENDVYIKLATNSTLETGKACWIITGLAGQTINVQGQYNSVPDFDLQADAANGRQNMVGHPLDISVDWANAQFIDGANVLTLAQVDPDIDGVRACEMDPPHASCIVSRIMNKWNGAAYQAFDGETAGTEGDMDQFEGIWVKSFKAGVQLRIPAIDNNAAAALAEAATAVTSADQSAGWSRQNGAKVAKPRASNPGYVRLIAKSGDLMDPGNVLGYLPDSRNGYDKHDLKELAPFSGDHLTIVFPHDNWDAFAGDYTTDFRSPHGKRWARWQFEVRTSLPVGTEVSLRWEAPENVLRFARLIDLANGERIRPHKNGEYRFQVKSEKHPFVWRMRRPVQKRIRRRPRR